MIDFLPDEPVQFWFERWLKSHIHRYPTLRWPDPESERGFEFYEGWIRQFEKHGVTFELAEKASIELQRSSPPVVKQLDAILRAVAGNFLGTKPGPARPGVPPHAPQDRELEDARRRSRDCEECCGPDPRTGLVGPSGFASRPARLSAYPRRPIWIALFCVCPLGRLLQRRELDGRKRHEDDLARWGAVNYPEIRPWDESIDGPLDRSAQKPTPGVTRQRSPGAGRKASCDGGLPQPKYTPESIQ